MDASRAFVLGLNAWALLAALPLFVGGPRELSAIAWLTAPLPFLAAGTALIQRQREIAGWLLLGAFPASLAGVVGGLGKLTLHSPFSTTGLSIGAVSLVAFGAAAALALTRPTRLRTAVWRPLDAVAPLEGPRVRWVGRRLLLAVTGAFALALALIAPEVGDLSGFAAAWGEAAEEAATLNAVMGGALGASLLALIVGPGLRASHRQVTRRRAGRRAAALIGLAGLALALYAFYTFSALGR